ncbi:MULTISPECIES: hypothetical protein [Sphingobacterium]|uniref:hypothetical protein n=1 Tax=Sphingobacterium TaxID=28453 RepID=UPI0013DD7E7E|nr:MULTISPECIES: hypothetical protein [unclassified Sphingobacterium]
MMRQKIFILLALFALSLSSCYVNKHPHGHVPPGKAKKVYGEKSAKRHAPGQQKKQHKKGNGHYKHSIYVY